MTGTLLGMHFIASNAGEMLSKGVIGNEYDAISADVSCTCFACLTLSEVLNESP